MATVQQFEDLIAWQKARQLTSRIYQASRANPFCNDFGLANQIQRAAVSVMANIAEGFERGRRKEFHQFLSMAKGSCGEVRSHLYAALDAGLVSADQFSSLHALAAEVGRIIGGLRAAVDSRP
jgi:four helix bundle protein